jgi:hypothetical protein
MLLCTPGNPLATVGCYLRFRVDKAGFIKRIRVVHSSGVEDFDFDCLCTVLSSAPLDKSLNRAREQQFYLANGQIGTESLNAIRRLNTMNRAKFRQRTNFTPDQYFLCNAVPLDVLFRYPGLFSEADVCNEDNLRAIPKTFFEKRNTPALDCIVANKSLLKFYRKWAIFFRDHSQATKADIQTFRDGIEQEFQSMFVLPSQLLFQAGPSRFH